uniref:Uncharacterized protein n=1 Tax=Knipowitschia caucasica TaxID=637954 RepID=A0AAV2IXN5_KNICA
MAVCVVPTVSSDELLSLTSPKMSQPKEREKEKEAGLHTQVQEQLQGSPGTSHSQGIRLQSVPLILHQLPAPPLGNPQRPSQPAMRILQCRQRPAQEKENDMV